MLHWRTFNFVLLIILQHTTVSSQQQNDSDSMHNPKDVDPSSSTTPIPGFQENSLDSEPNSGLGFDSVNGPRPFPNNNDPKMSNMPPGCKTVSGTWYNEVGSRIVITQGLDGNLTGTFYTLRQSDPGNKKPMKANIVGGAAFIKNSVILGFIVNWGDNGYTGVWTGQCYLCGKDEIIQTNWLMREPVQDCIDKWHANRFGHNTFTKTKPVDVPEEDIADQDDVPTVPLNKKPDSQNGDDTCSTLDGVWFNEIGSKLDLNINNDGTMQGVYDLPPTLGNLARSAKVIGISFYKEGDTFGISSINEDGGVVTSWAGQCQKCKVNDTEMVILNTYGAWRLWVPTCLEEFTATAYGPTKFTRMNFAPPMIPMHPGVMDHAGPMYHQGDSMDDQVHATDQESSMDYQEDTMMNIPPNSMSSPKNSKFPTEQKLLPGMTNNDTTSSNN